MISHSALKGLQPYLPYMRGWDKTLYQKEFSRFKDADRNHYRVFFPFKLLPNIEHSLIVAPKVVLDYLKNSGLSTVDGYNTNFSVNLLEIDT